MQKQNISKFKSNVIDATGLARANLFQVDLDFLDAVKSATNWADNTGGKYAGAPEKLGKFFVRAAQLPSSTIGVVEVPFRGRMLKIAGDRTFEPWTITIMNDQDYRVRSAMEIWLGQIQETDHNFSNLGVVTPKTGTATDHTYGTMKVKQLSRGGTQSKIVEYKFKNCYPSSISAIDLDWGSNDAIQEYTVEFQISHWEEDYA